ncbi:hypothetical protein GGS23DRAFT_158110 [Durotheca rogersii]|uniref:uncharacterized protein n=1 Tax=Durotheca rogersii TaxID=419775 RepID=UPI00221EE204|nr:uncharacterized protein GGS23DRAFT_158110 [Durotheca rogersii]KAI5861211.1 hypothetical protein GGS23DRAFT_158110 [Durotheca rogersii]
MSYHQRNEDSQPGLELAHSDDPEVYYYTPDKPDSTPIPVENPLVLPPPFKPEGGQYYVPPVDAAPGGGEPAAEAKGRSRRKLWIILGVIIAIIVIIAAVVGGVVGSRAASNSSSAPLTEAQGSNQSPSNQSPSPSTESTSPTTSASPTSSLSATVNTTAVRPRTKLSITGRRIAGSGFMSRLFWQGGDNKMRTSRYTSTSGSWSSPLVFNNIDAQPGTPIAATIYLNFPQFEVFYLDSSARFRGLNFGEDERVPKPDSVNDVLADYTVENDTKIAAYWPYVVLQARNSTFRRYVYGPGVGWFNDTVQGWFNPEVVPQGDPNTGVAVVPIVRDFQQPYAAGLAYRDRTGHLALFPFGGIDTGVAWYSGTPDVEIPAKTAIAGLAVTRRNSNITNTHILYQDAARRIQTVWQGDDNQWQGPEQVGQADAGTDIACLTEQAGDEPRLVSVSDQIDMSRCYYQLNGFIVEKRLTVTGWIDGDRIPVE